MTIRPQSRTGANTAGRGPTQHEAWPRGRSRRPARGWRWAALQLRAARDDQAPALEPAQRCRVGATALPERRGRELAIAERLQHGPLAAAEARTCAEGRAARSGCTEQQLV